MDCAVSNDVFDEFRDGPRLSEQQPRPSSADAPDIFDWLAIQRYPAFTNDFSFATTNRSSES